MHTENRHHQQAARRALFQARLALEAAAQHYEKLALVEEERAPGRWAQLCALQERCARIIAELGTDTPRAQGTPHRR
jgi:hypothetical protein